MHPIASPVASTSKRKPTSRPCDTINEAIRLNLIVQAWLQDVSSHADTTYPLPQVSTTSSTEASTTSCDLLPFQSPEQGMPMHTPKTPQTGRRGRSRGLQNATEEDQGDTEAPPGSPTPTRKTVRSTTTTTTTTTRRTARTESRGNNKGAQQGGPSGGRQGGPSSSSSMLQDEAVVGAATTASSASAYSAVFDALPLRIGGNATPSLSAASSQRGPSHGVKGRRTRSPVKDIADLRFAAKPIKLGLARNAPEFPQSVERLYNRLKDIREGKDVVPKSIAKEVLARERELQGRDTEIKDTYMTGGSGGTAASRKQYLAELDIMSDIVVQTATAMLERCSEAHWNECVHGPMLRAAAGNTNDPVVCSWNVTSARIASTWVPKDAVGGDFQDRMVDYCIALSDDKTCAASRAAVTRNMKSFALNGTGTSASETSSVASGDSGTSKTSVRRSATVPKPSVNHIDYAPLRERPIAVSIETKKSQLSGDEALAQLSVWAASHLSRLRYLFNEPGVIDTPLPLVQISGDTWQVLFAVDREGHIDVLRTFDLQGTSTLLGCYKVFAMLRALRDWSSGPFREWFLNSLVV